MRIGFTENLFEEEYPDRESDLATLAKLREMGCELIPISLPDYPLEAMSIVLEAEAAAFDDLTRSGADDRMVRQIKWAWPNVLRAARMIPAVEYIQANRLRTSLNRAMAKVMAQVDLYVAPSFGGGNRLASRASARI